MSEEIPDPPTVLFYKGTLNEDMQLPLAIVGTRRCTDYGKDVAKKFGRELGKAGATVISGLATGIDGYAALDIRCDVPRQLLRDTTAHAILSILRELTGNAIRHGGANEIAIAGAVEPDRIVFTVRDNGRGFDPAACDGPVQGHFGLAGVRNRLAKLNGTFTIESAPGAGATAVVSIPLPASRAQEPPKT